MLSQLFEILEEMKKANEVSKFDPEAGHGDADNLLLKTIESITFGTEYDEIANKIIQEYKDVEKYYL